jgi:hypothetical protein
MRPAALDLAKAIVTAGILSLAACTSGGGSPGGASGGAGSGMTTAAGTNGGAGTTAAAGTSGAAGTTAAAGTSGSAGTTAAAGTSGSAGMTATAGTSGSAGTTPDAGAAGGSAGAGGTSVGDGGTLTNAGPYTCTEFLGLLTTNEWYSKGFENDGVDGTKYQIKYHHFGYVAVWADPNSPDWGPTGDSVTEGQGSPIVSACAQNSATPDRVVFAALDWEMVTQDAWVTALTAAIKTIKAKYPGVKHIDVMSEIRCPMNKMCNPNEKYGPGANTGAEHEDCYVPPYQDAAYAQVAKDMPDLVGVGPVIYATMCKDPVDGTHLSDASNTQAAKDIAAYYKLHP